MKTVEQLIESLSDGVIKVTDAYFSVRIPEREDFDISKFNGTFLEHLGVYVTSQLAIFGEKTVCFNIREAYPKRYRVYDILVILREIRQKYETVNFCVVREDYVGRYGNVSQLNVDEVKQLFDATHSKDNYVYFIMED